MSISSIAQLIQNAGLNKAVMTINLESDDKANLILSFPTQHIPSSSKEIEQLRKSLVIPIRATANIDEIDAALTQAIAASQANVETNIAALNTEVEKKAKSKPAKSASNRVDLKPAAPAKPKPAPIQVNSDTSEFDVFSQDSL
ncbi:hypothetical protein [Shewanella sp. MBTL60-007]|uniref:hypothetical protein n=1 Tax=Shewanella sp. MBTL60-007 TaxID=2815911 RepID=UPI001BC6680C|nr:hypothetical protein [Shewanella sp. MBTL60-007]GIU21097.1 hypothetical protein TUM3792_21620 [Shewanella sp. MBTL60-007]